MLKLAVQEICPADKFQLLCIANSFLLIVAEHENRSAMPTSIGIFIFINREKFILS